MRVESTRADWTANGAIKSRLLEAHKNGYTKCLPKDTIRDVYMPRAEQNWATGVGYNVYMRHVAIINHRTEGGGRSGEIKTNIAV